MIKFRICRAVVARGLASVVGLALCTAPVAADGLRAFDDWDGTWSHTAYVGNMTSDRVEGLFEGPSFIDNYLVGYALTYDHPLNARWSVGAELQFTYHFGDQTYGEVGLPFTLRYRPERPWPRPVEALAFGLGMSHATKIPQVEIEKDDGSRRNLFYWLAEVEFKTDDPGRTWFVRIHHRSNAWGVLEPNGGSNALALGIRHDF
ncbi:MAG: hypothetical protein AB8B62_12795 [Roseobacter sp.]